MNHHVILIFERDKPLLLHANYNGKNESGFCEFETMEGNYYYFNPKHLQMVFSTDRQEVADAMFLSLGGKTEIISKTP